MADLTIKTSLEPRYNLPLILKTNFNDEFANSEFTFLGGCHDGDDDYDLYLVNHDVYDVAKQAEDPRDYKGYAVLAARVHKDEEDAKNEPRVESYDEPLKEVDIGSYALLIEAKRRAIAEGYIKEPTPFEDPGTPEKYRNAIKVEAQREAAIYLGTTVAKGEPYELYFIEGNKEKEWCTHVCAIFAGEVDEGDNRLAKVWIESRLPHSREDVYIALTEAIRRARNQGFNFSLGKEFNDLNLEGYILAMAKEENLAAYVNNKDNHTSNVTLPSTSRSTNGATPSMTNTNSKEMKKFTHVTVATSGDEQIHLPKGMTFAQAREWLTTIERNEEQQINWVESFDAYPPDGALAFQRVLNARFGNATKAGATNFWGFEVPPPLVAIETGVNEKEHVPWGHFTLPIMPEHKINVGAEYKENQYFFRITATIKRKYKPLMDELAAQVRHELRTGSIYRGKAFRLKFPTEEQMASDGYDPDNFAPKFISVAGPGQQPIFSDKVRVQIETSIFSPVMHTDVCRKYNVPLKRGILLEGKYGTGKTLTAAVLSRLCVQHGWTFIYLENVRDLEKAMRFARRYEPAVIFAEDIDTVMTQQDDNERDEEMNKILNTIDGVDMKNIDQMVVLTTNYVTNITRAMLRPGRLDAVITVEPPDEKAVIQLMRQYAGGLLSNEKDENLLKAARLLAGQIPSVVREVVERSKLASIFRAGKDGSEVCINAADLLVAAEGIAMHLELLKEPEADTRSDREKAADRLGLHVAQAIRLVSSNNVKTHVLAPISTKQLPSSSD